MELTDVAGRVRAAAADSVLIRTVQAIAADGGIHFALASTPVRPLSTSEIHLLEANGNRADDWSKVQVVDPFDARRIQHSFFYGDIVLGRFAGRTPLAPDVNVPTGIYRCTIANCIVGHDSRLYDVGLIANYVVAEGAVLEDCGRVLCDGETTFGNGQELSIAVATGGREVPVYAEMDVEIASLVARAASNRQLLRDYRRAVADYVARCTTRRGIIERAAAIRHTPVLKNVYVGVNAQIDGATAVEHSSLVSSPDEPVRIESGAYVINSLIQWGSHVATMSIVDRSVMTEHSRVERHGKVTASILGSNTGIAEGEVTSSLLGPFVGFHHQALLIAAYWPEGKGNVGYGANVGSNHTSKAPDQEFWPGEGLFLGLGVNIKYPADLSRAPYSIVATGVTTLPQKVTFPFSLINQPSLTFPGISPAYNEIVPAWLLIDNMYALKRNEVKYKGRNKARRTRLDFEVFRPPIVDLMIDARRRLQAVGELKEVYTDGDIVGLGKNFMLESSRQAAIDSYSFYIRYYALLALWNESRRRREQGSTATIPHALSSPCEDRHWEHARRLLHDELGFVDALSALRALPKTLERVAQDVERSKAKDDQRGMRIIDDYADVHTLAARDKFVGQCWDDTRRMQHEVGELIADLEQNC